MRLLRPGQEHRAQVLALHELLALVRWEAYPSCGSPVLGGYVKRNASSSQSLHCKNPVVPPGEKKQ